MTKITIPKTKISLNGKEYPATNVTVEFNTGEEKMSKRKKLSYLINGFTLGVGLIVSFQAIGDFDKAKTGVEVFKALFWLTVGSVCWISSWHSLRED